MTPAPSAEAGLTDQEYERIAQDPWVQHWQCRGGATGLAEWLGVPYESSSTGSYDLSGAAFDQPERRDAPARSLVIAATYRSGSTLVAEELIRAGGYGWPLEYLQRGADATRFRRFAGADYLARVMAHRTDANGTFAVKLFPADVREHDLVPLSGTFPDPLVVWVRRGNHVAQAVSAWRALGGGPWRSIDAPAETAGTSAGFDYSALYRLIGLFAAQDRWWQQVLAAVTPLTVWFEDLQGDRVATVDALLAQLAEVGRPSLRHPGEPRLQRQADAESGRWEQRFVAEFRSGRRPGHE